MAKRAGKIASRYAKALLRVSDGLSSDLDKISEVWRESKELRDVSSNPMFDKSQRQQALLKVCKQLELEANAQRFVSVVFEKDRINFLPEIAAEYLRLVSVKANNVDVEVSVAKEISQEETKQLEQSLSGVIAGNLNFSWNVDPSIIGGILVQYQGKVLDGTIKGKLNRIEKELLGAH